MNRPIQTELCCYVAGEPVRGKAKIEVHDPYSDNVVGTVVEASGSDVEAALLAALDCGSPPTRFERYEILEQARLALEAEASSFASLICAEAGLCMRETRYEVGRAQEVLRGAGMAALHDDGKAFAGDVSPGGKARRIFTQREPHRVVVAITPFNHPLNQVVHKLAPAIAAGVPVILKPSEKTPLTAIRFAELLYRAGLPGKMLSVLLGPHNVVSAPLIEDPRVEVVSFTGSGRIGKQIARQAGYKKVCLELGGNAPLIVLEDADLELAITLAAEGCYRNSGQRCTAVKRLLVHEKILDAFTKGLVSKTEEYPCGRPSDEKTRIGTVIDTAAAKFLEDLVTEAERSGTKTLTGGRRLQTEAKQSAQMPPTVLANVSRDTRMVVEEAFGPLAPIIAIKNLADAIAVANSTAYGLATGVVTRNLESALRCVREIRTGTVNINEVPGWRVETSPFGGIKDSGAGIKEGVIEAMKFLTWEKTFSVAW